MRATVLQRMFPREPLRSPAQLEIGVAGPLPVRPALHLQQLVEVVAGAHINREVEH